MWDAGNSNDFVLCRYNSDGTWTWHYADDLREDANAYDFPMVPYDGTWRYPDDEDANIHDFLMCWHRSDGTWIWYYADDLREGAGSRDFQTVLCRTTGHMSDGRNCFLCATGPLLSGCGRNSTRMCRIPER